MDKLTINDLVNPSIDNNEEDNQSITDKIKLIAVTNLLSKDNLKTNSRIKIQQVPKLTKMLMYGEIFEIPFIKELAENILELQISVNGLGRKELVELVGKVYNPMESTIELSDRQLKRGVFK